MNDLRVAVFCGFRLDTTDPDLPNEVLFTYQLLKIFACAKLDLTSSSPDDLNPEFALERFREFSGTQKLLFDKFRIFYSNMRPGFLEGLKPLLEGDFFDYALVVVPVRKCRCGTKKARPRTTPFVPMEFALAEGYGKAPIAFVEQDVPDDEIPLITLNVRPHQRFSRADLPNPHKWDSIYDELKELEQQALKNRRIHIGLPNATIEEFYLKLCKLLLTATSVSIVNHSLLPLGSTFDHDDTGTLELPEQGKSISARDLYFEFEAALVSETTVRLERVLNRGPRAWRTVGPAMKDRVKLWAEDEGREFTLERAVSVPVWEQYDNLDQETKNAIRQRYLSIFRALGRMEKRQNEANVRANKTNQTPLRIAYTLRAFKSSTLRSFPTTMYIRHDNDTETGIWGFLRGNQLDARHDDFLIAHNCQIVSVWKKHVEMYFIDEGDLPAAERHDINLVEKGSWNEEAVFDGCKRLQQMIGKTGTITSIARELTDTFSNPAPGFARWLKEQTHDNSQM